MTLAEDAAAIVARTCAAQGPPERVTDPAVLARVAAILAASKGNAGPHHKAGVTNTITNSISHDRTLFLPRKEYDRGPV